MSENIKPTVYLRWIDSGIQETDEGDPCGAGFYDQAAIEAARQDGFRSALEMSKEVLAQQEQEIADLRRQLAAVQSVVRQNHEWHQNYDEYGGYPDSELCLANESVICAHGTDTTTLDALLADKEREMLDLCARVALDYDAPTVERAIRAMMTKEKSHENNT
jgi:hypothetical protein